MCTSSPILKMQGICWVKRDAACTKLYPRERFLRTFNVQALLNTVPVVFYVMR